MIETPTAAITIETPAEHDEPDSPLSKGEAEKENLLDAEQPVIEVVHIQPITRSIITTMRHLTAQAGFRSRWRGLGGAIIYGTAFHFLSNLVFAVVPTIPGRFLGEIAATMILARHHMAWTHAMISTPSSKPYLSRVLPRSTWKAVAFPAAACFIVTDLALFVAAGFTHIIFFQVDIPNVERGSGTDIAIWAIKIIAAITVGVCAVLFVAIPAHVTLTRIEASLLPEEEDTIVPFDRSFGGRVVPAVIGGTGAIGFLEAWKTFNWEARRRVVKLYIKIFFVTCAILFVGAHVVAAVAYAAIGPEVLRTGFAQVHAMRG
ncbi:hypothetical protein W97_08674 [Coniosporium apollinis CBS 100218]|uniref:Uncharacterized protein n=1 Tax=Coniosporium apollinis (strain CBS 100218) TaxID=1168221 RepID=R7Z5W9_CONA1|nr:uncharacterized protein W97_08674 [Coniosporium apollinis CBS 100218]EON69414.1 hypothetical protein W97_08674 [Coniosporium apollinis CBS 100218]